MKKFISALVILFTVTVSANAMSYEQARQQALFLTDKMAYELNLDEAQYEAAFEINLDYLMNVMTPDDLYGVYWRQRNLDLGYILFDWQYSAFCAASYFYRPLYWDAGFWHFGIYARYPHRDYFYFGRPHFYAEYRGGHSWHNNGGRSWYDGRQIGPRGGNAQHFGMRDGFNRGDYGKGQRGINGAGNRQQMGNGNMGNRQQPSNGSFGNRRGIANGQGQQKQTINRNGSMRNNANQGVGSSKPNNTFTPRSQGGNSVNKQSGNNSSFGGGRIGNSRGTIGNSRGMLNRSTNSTQQVNRGSGLSNSTVRGGGLSRSAGSVTRSTSTPQRSVSAPSSTPQRSSMGSSSRGSSFGGSRSSSFSGGSRSGGMSHSSGGGSHSGGGSFGGRR